jgi:hypothetical protein
MKLITHLHLLPRSRMVVLYFHSPLCLHSIVLNNIIKYRDNFTFTMVDSGIAFVKTFSTKYYWNSMKTYTYT